jgi:hypothetical protein
MKKMKSIDYFVGIGIIWSIIIFQRAFSQIQVSHEILIAIFFYIAVVIALLGIWKRKRWGLIAFTILFILKTVFQFTLYWWTGLIVYFIAILYLIFFWLKRKEFH